MQRPIPTRVDDAIYALHELVQVRRGSSYDATMTRIAEMLEAVATEFRHTSTLPDEHDHGG